MRTIFLFLATLILANCGGAYDLNKAKENSHKSSSRIEESRERKLNGSVNNPGQNSFGSKKAFGY